MGRVKNAGLIESLNQRGGRMLSVIDLLEAGTMDIGAASFLAFLMSENPSFISCAGPGGAGKTTLMGALLAHLPADVEIVEYGRAPRIRENACVMAHEINRAPYRGYVWGEEAERFLNLRSSEKNLSVCATAHADSPGELEELLAREHGIEKSILQELDFLAFINYTPAGRKLTALCQPDGAGFRRIYEFNSREKDWKRQNLFDWRRIGVSEDEFEEGLESAHESIEKLLAGGAGDIRSVMKLL